MNVQVMCRGKLCVIIGMFQVSLFSDGGTGLGIHIVYELEPVEATRIGAADCVFHVKRDGFYFPPSAIDFRDSEWAKGVLRGKSE